MTVAFMPRRTRRAAAPVIQPEVAPVRPQVEAPDLGEAFLPHEAPEARTTRHAEAPDAGSGRSFCIEGDFTHGRSRS